MQTRISRLTFHGSWKQADNHAGWLRIVRRRRTVYAGGLGLTQPVDSLGEAVEFRERMVPLFRSRQAIEDDHEFGNPLPEVFGSREKLWIGVFFLLDQPLVQAVLGVPIVRRFQDFDQLRITPYLMCIPGRQDVWEIHRQADDLLLLPVAERAQPVLCQGDDSLRSLGEACVQAIAERFFFSRQSLLQTFS